MGTNGCKPPGQDFSRIIVCSLHFCQALFGGKMSPLGGDICKYQFGS